MILRTLLLCSTLAAAALAVACQNSPNAAEPQQDIVVPGKVEDVPAFDRFISGKPTPEQFRKRYPDVKLVLPGEIATREFRMDRSRYFAELDADGRISGGKFM
ncbi:MULTISPECIES: hypothetical protein [Hydrocarboniphaga]|uniref:Lipoprotein n=1 Tax=Hydrocarboniphaga effusa AP103 TaxID=1172194 RepID=I8T5T3_9GAMM|nr:MULTISPECIES: hypothetical protein [Hydrocarboniphaga]EIT69078.1 hypothetical protein WQQ_26600 [Hydrocarboniphaga effusa AP103]MDZ4078555.1 hypothetical protein [Hydrocarboniphaga sp.]